MKLSVIIWLSLPRDVADEIKKETELENLIFKSFAINFVLHQKSRLFPDDRFFRLRLWQSCFPLQE